MNDLYRRRLHVQARNDPDRRFELLGHRSDGIKLTKQMNAKVTGLHVTVPFHVLATDNEALTETRGEYERHTKAAAQKIIAAFEKDAKDAGVAACETIVVASAHPYEVTINAARVSARKQWRGAFSCGD